MVLVLFRHPQVVGVVVAVVHAAAVEFAVATRQLLGHYYEDADCEPWAGHNLDYVS